MKNVNLFTSRFATILLVAFTIAAGSFRSWAADPSDCCLELPDAPDNEADGIVTVTFGGPVGGPGFGNGLPPEFSLFTVDILPGGGGSPVPPVPPGRYAGWCFDSETDISPAPGGSLYGARLYSSCDPDVSFNQFLPDHPNVKKDATHWKKINYLINRRFEACDGQVPTMWEVQRAIFTLFGQPSPPAPPYPPFRPEVVQCLVDDANANGPNFELKCGDKVAVIFNIEINWDNIEPEIQLLFIEVPFCPPVICPEDVTIECDESLDPNVNTKLGVPTLSECCDAQPAPTYVDSTPVGECPTVITRTWTVPTACGPKTCVQIITIVDTIGPVITGVGGPLDIDCKDEVVFSEPAAMDECGEVESFTFEDQRIDGNCPGNYSVTRTWTAVDNCGNVTTASQTINVSDTTPPVISGVGGSLVIECTDPLVFSDPTVIDDCSGVKTFTYADVRTEGDCANSYSVTRTWTAVDNCGNVSTASQKITVLDTTPPQIQCPPDRDLACGEPTDPDSTGRPTATDNCSSTGALVITHTDSVVVDADGTTIITRTWTVEDECGNKATCVQIIRLRPGICEPGKFYFSGSSSSKGQPNTRTFTTSSGVSVKVTGFSRTKDSGNWSPAFVAQYSGGLGITDSSEDGSSPNHTVDNVGRHNYLLFEFSQPVIVSEAFLGWVYNDSDLSIRIGTFPDPYNNHITLNDSTFAAFAYAEDDDTTSGSTRTASFNAGQVSGNAFIIAGSLSDTTPDDYFKVKTLEFCVPVCEPPVVKASLGDFVWNDANANGIQEAGEPGVGGVKVELFSCDNSLIASTTTAADGKYLFADLMPGDYYVKFSDLPPGFVFSTSSSSGASDPNDSDANPATGVTDCTTLEGGENDLSWDAGINKPQPPPEEPCVPTKIVFNGSSAGDGPNGNIRTFSAGGVSVKVSAFSRSSGGNWAEAYLGIYSGGLGVTDSSEGDGSNNRHTVDNIDRRNYVLFEFSAPVVVNSAFLGYVVSDSDLTVWVGNYADPYNNHLTLSDAVLGAASLQEDDDTTSSSSRWAEFNSGEVTGNVLIIAASTSDTTPDDQFKIEKLDICAPPAEEEPCPSPWGTKDIGYVKASGSITYNSETKRFTVKGSGDDIWNSSDEFRYGYVQASGDCLIAARVVSQGNTDPWAKAGVMIRESLNDNSQHASAFITPGNGAAFQYRTSTGGSSGNVNQSWVNAPHWVAVVRDGNTFTAYQSNNGVDWTPIGSKYISMNWSVYIGLAVTSHNDGALSSAVFEGVFAAP